MSEDKFGFGKMLKRLQDAKVDMPKKMAETGEDYFRKNFKKQQSPDDVQWQPRMRETKRSMGKPILYDTGNLYRAMEHTIMSFDWKKIVWGISRDAVPYAGYLNYGTNKMVARPFLEDGKEIRGKMLGIIKRTFDKVILNR